MQMKQKGFTLVELIVVIVILGILAATALPKFIDLSSDARFSVMKGVEAAARGANTMIYGKAAANNQLSGSGSVTVTINGAPIGVSTTAGYAADMANLYKVLDLNPSTDFDQTGDTIQHKKASAPSNCALTYTNTNGSLTYTPPSGSSSCS